MQKALIRYIYHFRPQPQYPDIENVFLSIDGLPLIWNAVKMVFQNLAKKCRLKRYHPHLCRHTFATNYLVNGGDVFSLQHILGHTTLEMVRHYVNLASSQIAVQHRKFSPIDRLKVPIRQKALPPHKAGDKGSARRRAKVCLASRSPFM